MPFDYEAYDAKCAAMDMDQLQREWNHYTRLIAGGNMTTAMSTAASIPTGGVSSIGIVHAAPAIYNARKKREIIDKHFARLGATHSTLSSQSIESVMTEAAFDVDNFEPQIRMAHYDIIGPEGEIRPPARDAIKGPSVDNVAAKPSEKANTKDDNVRGSSQCSSNTKPKSSHDEASLKPPSEPQASQQPVHSAAGNEWAVTMNALNADSPGYQSSPTQTRQWSRDWDNPGSNDDNHSRSDDGDITSLQSSLFDRESKEAFTTSSAFQTSTLDSAAKIQQFGVDGDLTEAENENRWETATIYSTTTHDGNSQPQYIFMFANQLVQDAAGHADRSPFLDVSPGKLDELLQAFSWFLHGESDNPFQWEVSVILNRMRREIRSQCGSDHLSADGEDAFPGDNDDADEDERERRDPHRKSRTLVQDWVNGVDPTSEHEMAQYLKYEHFVKSSKSYNWLIKKIQTYSSLNRDRCHAMEDLRQGVQNLFVQRDSSRIMSRSRPATGVELSITLHDWDIVAYLKSCSKSKPHVKDLDSLLCLTGSPDEAQLTLVTEYFSQTWPETYQPVLLLLKELVHGDLDTEYCWFTLWHFLFTEHEDERIAYDDSRIPDMNRDISINLRQLENSRHIVGWCDKAADLCEAGADVVLGANMQINKKVPPVRLTRTQTYPRLLSWVATQSIIFHDVQADRAWLIDGASALLHIVRASLHRSMKDDDSPYDWLFDTTQLQETPENRSGRQAAIGTLKKAAHLDLPLYRLRRKSTGQGSGPEYFTFGDLVEEVLHTLELLIDAHSQLLRGGDGYEIPKTLDQRRRITGFDLIDIIDPPGSLITPRAKSINDLGDGWCDLAQSLRSLVIFGRGFGELIKPDGERGVVCSLWSSLPSNMDYLGASTSTLQMLYQKQLLRDQPTLKVGQLSKSLTWVSRPLPENGCSCDSAGNSDLARPACSFHPVQSLVRGSLLQKLGIRSYQTPIDVMALDGRGAMIFEHRVSLHRLLVRGDSLAGPGERPSEDETTLDSSLRSLEDASGNSELQDSQTTVLSTPRTSISGSGLVTRPQDQAGASSIGTRSTRLTTKMRIKNMFRRDRT
ncbi:uncharacterized protein B0I36DRAFT_429788 [Microdochium trichocladiopsis]|uniref:Uncharacterized protein n=1 Tax=Microdochium trichocladiopsis TaxID=1682393 RepID=A0A9P8YC29_9PEZI|nr:uncharacterized protein B0I36DRAFT_429788 [Microdochium trichocladiopsis]KAH7035738.1 hypothetical protein B0I36DRAFT_429788 [Microdochium trichocladiopsis]